MEVEYDVLNLNVPQAHKVKLINVKDTEAENDVMNMNVPQAHKVKLINV
jgi:hypothetical protein